MGNYSQDPQTVLQTALTKGYSRVRFQQGKPVLDRELNLAAELVGPERIAQAYIGNGTPSGSNGFAIGGLNLAGNEFTISAGQALVNGQMVTLTANTTYRTQPIQTHFANLPNGASNIYLRVLQTEVSSQQDSDLANPNDILGETAIRIRVDWEVVVSVAPIPTPDYYLLATLNTVGPALLDQRRLGLTAAAIRDEVNAARGTAPSLTNRLSTSLGPAGALVAGSVSTAQLANGAVTIAKLAQTLVFNGQVSVPAAPAAGQSGVASISLIQTEDPAFLLVSVHFDAPRPALLPAQTLNQSFTWELQTNLVKAAGVTGIQHVYGLLIQNPSTQAISVTCKAYRLIEA
jgi:hypothetical protein